MKAEELKIGDLVLYKDKVIRVKEVSFGFCGGLNENNFWIGDIPTEEVESIPLTEEILGKNGWKKNLYAEGMYHKDPFIFKQCGKRWGFVVYDDLCIISSVHQLQHILWALGMDDNLKI